MDKMDKEYIKITIKITITVILFIVICAAMLSIPTLDYSDTEAQVKVQEVGTRYAFLNIGEQEYVRVQNAYSEQYSASSESWETCIDKRDIKLFKEAKDNRTTLNIRVKGNGLSTIFTCINGDKVIEIK